MKKLRQYTTENVVICPSTNPEEPDLILTVTPDLAGWDFISFQDWRLSAGKAWSFRSGENELAIVVLYDAISERSNRGNLLTFRSSDATIVFMTSVVMMTNVANIQ
jgi:5-deoxy-D-glucuronate isomerase